MSLCFHLFQTAQCAQTWRVTWDGAAAGVWRTHASAHWPRPGLASPPGPACGGHARGPRLWRPRCTARTRWRLCLYLQKGQSSIQRSNLHIMSKRPSLNCLIHFYKRWLYCTALPCHNFNVRGCPWWWHAKKLIIYQQESESGFG